MKRLIGVAFLLALGACGDRPDIDVNESPVVCDSFAASHAASPVAGSIARWRVGDSFGSYPATPSTVAWSTGTISRQYTGGLGNYATFCSMHFATQLWNQQGTPGPFGKPGCQTIAVVYNGTCNWSGGGSTQVPNGSYRIYPTDAPYSYVEQSYGVTAPSGALVSLNLFGGDGRF